MKYFGGAFAVAALPEAIDGCSAPPVPGASGAPLTTLDLSSVAITWVTRKQDGLSLGFQFVNLVSDASHNIALAPGSAAGSAYAAITFPPQHIMEDAVLLTTAPPVVPPPFDYTHPNATYASGTSRLVFNIPATLGTTPDDGGAVETFPYTLQGMLDLCTRSALVVHGDVVSADAKPLAATELVSLRSSPEDLKHETISQARIDRVIARVDPRAAHRVRRRALRAANALKVNTAIPTGIPIRPLDTTGVVAPSASETSIELPFRLLMSPEAGQPAMGWSFMSSPVVSPSTSLVDAKRTELWHARPGMPDPTTGLPDPSLGAITLRALWTRDYDVYGVDPGGIAPLNPSNATQYTTDPVKYANPIAPDRAAIVENTADTGLPPLTVNRLLLSPLGGTIDLKASFPSSTSLVGWTQNTVLGRDEYVETVVPGTLLPFGHAATLTTITKRASDPTQGSVGVLYSQTYLVVSQPLVSYHGVGNASDYNTFPFVAVELKQTQIPCAPIGGSGPVLAPGAATAVSVGANGTDFRGNAIEFATPVYFCALGLSAGRAIVAWPSPTYQFNRQRIAYAPPNDSSTATPSTFAPDSTSFETASFVIALALPAMGINAPASALVPVAKTITIAIEAFRHLQATPAGGTPNVDCVFDYDTTLYKANGFESNPNQIFLVQAAGSTSPSLNFADGPAASNSAGLVAPAFAANAISRSSGTMAGTTGDSQSALMTGKFDPGEYFGTPPTGGPKLPPGGGSFLDKIKLFGFIPLSGIIVGLEDLASDFMPKSVTQQISNAEAFLQKAIQFIGIIESAVGTSSDSSLGQIGQVLSQVSQDITSYGQLAQGLLSTGGTPITGVNGAAPPTNAEMQAAAWLGCAAVQAESMIKKWGADIKTAAADIDKLFTDLTQITDLPDVGKVVTDLITFIKAVEKILADVESVTSSMAGSNSASPSPQSAAGAVLSYFGPVATALKAGADAVNPYLQEVNGVLKQLVTDLTYLQQGLDMVKNLAVEFKWKPKITGYECLDAVAFIPSTDQAFSLDVKVNANSNNGPIGLSVACRLDSFAVAFGQGIKGDYKSSCSIMPVGYSKVIKDADISVVFDHVAVQMLAGSKPDIDCKFKDIYFGGDLAFIETIKNLIPLDSFSDPPFIKVTTSGITAGFTLPIPNIAIGMFSIQNINIGAALNLPWIGTDIPHGLTFDFDFCTIDNPFTVTVSMLGGGGFFGLTLDMQGMQRVQFGISVGAQLAIDLTVASGSVSIEAGIFLVYMEPDAVPTGTTVKDPVTGLTEVPGWVIGGYLRLRGELDILGIVTISVELYLQITYESASGKCIATGFIKVDISLFFFSIHVKVSFTRKFAGSNGDPTFAEMMVAGGVDPMVDPALLSADTGAVWDPFAEYCMAYA